MTVHVDVAPTILDWAVERAGWDVETAERRFPQLTEWRAGTLRPTVKQLERFAKATHAPFGQLFLSAPPEEPLPVPDMRTLRDTAITRPSADLLDTIYQCQMRQIWFRDHAVENGMDPVAYVGTATTGDAPAAIAQRMRGVLGVDPRSRPLAPSWNAAFRLLSERVEASGTLVMVNGVVGSDTHRALRPEEFRGFTLVDDLAPVVFINGADSKSAQIFTLLLEFAHVWLGGSALSDVVPGEESGPPEERWCNAVAAEFLMPNVILRSRLEGDVSAVETENRFGGGNFYTVHLQRLSRQFARAVVASAREGGTSYRDAYKLLGTKKHSTFEGIADRVGRR